MSDESPNLSRHGVRLTEALLEVHGDESLDPRAAGAILRKMRTGVTNSALSIAADPSIEFAEKGRILAVIAMVADSFEQSYARPGPTGLAKMPALRSR